jgi:hypothetical protein
MKQPKYNQAICITEVVVQTCYTVVSFKVLHHNLPPMQRVLEILLCGRIQNYCYKLGFKCMMKWCKNSDVTEFQVMELRL